MTKNLMGIFKFKTTSAQHTLISNGEVYTII